jgi:hypothetical protein
MVAGFFNCLKDTHKKNLPAGVLEIEMLTYGDKHYFFRLLFS